MLHALAGRVRRLVPPAAAVMAVLLVAGPAPVLARADGPDFWVVHGVPKGDTLSIRSGPSTTRPIIRQLPNGYVLRNLGCNPQRWCQVKAPDGSFTGWAFGQYLQESAGPGGHPPGFPPGGRPPGFPPGQPPGFPPGHPPGFPPGSEMPEVVPQPRGEFELRWRNGCIVRFDRFGERISASRTCTRAQKDQSDELVRRYLNGQGGPGGRPPFGGGGGGGGSGPQGGALAVGQMADYCLGEAAGHFRVKPGALRTNPAFNNGRGYTVIGWFAQQPGRGFRCQFRQNRTFEGVFE